MVDQSKISPEWILDENRRFVAEHARYLATTYGHTRAMELHRKILDLRAVKWLELGVHGRCPLCIKCSALRDGSELCTRCTFLRDEIWPIVGEKGKSVLFEFLTVRTGEQTDPQSESEPVLPSENRPHTIQAIPEHQLPRPPEQFD